jgi:hypothetical protein
VKKKKRKNQAENHPPTISPAASGPSLFLGFETSLNMYQRIPARVKKNKKKKKKKLKKKREREKKSKEEPTCTEQGIGVVGN